MDGVGDGVVDGVVGGVVLPGAPQSSPPQFS